MATTLDKLIGDISLLLIMVDPNESMGYGALIELLSQAKEKAAEEKSSDQRFNEAFKYLLSQQDKISPQEYLKQVNDFISSTQSYMTGNTAVRFANEVSADSDISEFAEYYDAEFLPDFVAKHLSLLEEFEGAVVEFRFKAAEADEETCSSFQKYLKSYLHNLKGDAGSVGLQGIEQVTHQLEDNVINSSQIALLLDQLLAFKEWATTAAKALVVGAPFPVSSATFLSQLKSSNNPQATKETTNAAVQVLEAPVAPASAEAPNTSAPGLGTYSINAEPELLAEFIAEATDHIDSVESLLLEKNDDLSNKDIDTVFRAVHSLKGASSYFNLKEINETSHNLETILGEVRDGKRTFDPPLLGLTFRYIDLQKALLAQVAQASNSNNMLTRTPAGRDYLVDLGNYANGASANAKDSSATKNDTIVTSSPVDEHLHSATPQATEVAEHSDVVSAQRSGSDGSSKQATDKNAMKSFVKVDTARLDSLIDSIGEMVIYSSMLINACRTHLGDNENVVKTTHQVEKFSRHLQDIGMSMRLDPIKALFQKMSRIVWDASKKLGKEVSFVMYGEDTELDRNVIEKLADPLMHMVRNAIDHGVETPAEREAAGKSRGGRIELGAYHAGGSIHVVIKDDGRGLNPDKLRKKAIEKGIIAEGQVLTEAESFQLIFAAGFSTAQTVTDISGRGVGMDVVRSNIEAMRGHVRITSEVGKGTTFTIELPLTLAIIDGIEMTVGKEFFILPTLSILEFMRPTAEMLHCTMGKGENFLFRGEYLPMFRVSSLYNIPDAVEDATRGIVVVVENGGERVALLVDDLLGSCQTVIKSLGEFFKQGNGLAGCAIMPSGNIGLILDVRSLVQLAHNDYSCPTLLELSAVKGRIESDAQDHQHLV